MLDHLTIPSKTRISELSSPELKLEIRRLKAVLHQYLTDNSTKEEVYYLSCRIDELIVEYQKRSHHLQ